MAAYIPLDPIAKLIEEAFGEISHPDRIQKAIAELDLLLNGEFYQEEQAEQERGYAEAEHQHEMEMRAEHEAQQEADYAYAMAEAERDQSPY